MAIEAGKNAWRTRRAIGIDIARAPEAGGSAQATDQIACAVSGLTRAIEDIANAY